MGYKDFQAYIEGKFTIKYRNAMYRVTVGKAVQQVRELGLTDDEIVELASLSKVKFMACSHLYRDVDEERLNLLSKKKGYGGRLVVAKDLMRFDF